MDLALINGRAKTASRPIASRKTQRESELLPPTGEVHAEHSGRCHRLPLVPRTKSIPPISRVEPSAVSNHHQAALPTRAPTKGSPHHATHPEPTIIYPTSDALYSPPAHIPLDFCEYILCTDGLQVRALGSRAIQKMSAGTGFLFIAVGVVPFRVGLPREAIQPRSSS